MNKYIDNLIEYLHNDIDLSLDLDPDLNLEKDEYLHNILIEILTLRPNSREALSVKKEMLDSIKQALDEHNYKILEIILNMMLRTKEVIRLTQKDFDQILRYVRRSETRSSRSGSMSASESDDESDDESVNNTEDIRNLVLDFINIYKRPKKWSGKIKESKKIMYKKSR